MNEYVEGQRVVAATNIEDYTEDGELNQLVAVTTPGTVIRVYKNETLDVLFDQHEQPFNVAAIEIRAESVTRAYEADLLANAISYADRHTIDVTVTVEESFTLKLVALGIPLVGHFGDGDLRRVIEVKPDKTTESYQVLFEDMGDNYLALDSAYKLFVLIDQHNPLATLMYRAYQKEARKNRVLREFQQGSTS